MDIELSYGMHECVFNSEQSATFFYKKKYVYVSSSHWFFSCKQNVNKKVSDNDVIYWIIWNSWVNRNKYLVLMVIFLKTEYYMFFAILNPDGQKIGERSMKFNRKKDHEYSEIFSGNKVIQ